MIQHQVLLHCMIQFLVEMEMKLTKLARFSSFIHQCVVLSNIVKCGDLLTRLIPSNAS